MTTVAVWNDPARESGIEIGGGRLSKDVLLMENGDAANLLDFEQGRFYALNPMAARMLTGYLRDGFQPTAERIASEDDEGVPVVERHLSSLLGELEGLRLICRNEESPTTVGPRSSKSGTTGTIGAARRRLAVAAVAITIRAARILHRRRKDPPNSLVTVTFMSLAWLSLRMLGWSASLELFRRFHADGCSLSALQRREVIAEIDRLVRTHGFNSLFLPKVCKERAFSAAQMLATLYGIPAEIVVGVDNFPFSAHAWVQTDGMLITDNAENCSQFTEVARYR